MRKKLFKYIKFLVSMVLILGLIAPSYASLSASDGSAFVTKAEFDSALADFNSRLTTFEAGINSKIDSQVTSYLDRNGIWNGKDQEVTKYGNGLLTDENYKNTLIYKIFTQKDTNHWAEGVLNTLKSSWRCEQWKIIDSISKSGLLYFVWCVDAIAPGASAPAHPLAYSWTNFCVTDTTGQYENTLWTGLGFTKVENSSNLSDWYNLEPFICETVRATQGGVSISSDQRIWNTALFSGTSLFFVSKNDSVFWGMMYTANTASAVGYIHIEHNSSAMAERADNVYFHTLSAKVY